MNDIVSKELQWQLADIRSRIDQENMEIQKCTKTLETCAENMKKLMEHEKAFLEVLGYDPQTRSATPSSQPLRPLNGA